MANLRVLAVICPGWAFTQSGRMRFVKDGAFGIHSVVLSLFLGCLNCPAQKEFDRYKPGPCEEYKFLSECESLYVVVSFYYSRSQGRLVQHPNIPTYAMILSLGKEFALLSGGYLGTTIIVAHNLMRWFREDEQSIQRRKCCCIAQVRCLEPNIE